MIQINASSIICTLKLDQRFGKIRKSKEEAMSYFASLKDQQPIPMPQESPVWEFRPDTTLLPEHVPLLRHMVIDALGTEAVSSYVGYPVPTERCGDIEVAVSEVITNAIRPGAIPPRHLTRICIWASQDFVRVSVGDDISSVAGNDGRPQTPILEPDSNKRPSELYDPEVSMSLYSTLDEAGLGGSIVEALAEVSFSRTQLPDNQPPEDGSGIEQKIIHLGFALTQDMLGRAA